MYEAKIHIFEYSKQGDVIRPYTTNRETHAGACAGGGTFMPLDGRGQEKRCDRRALTENSGDTPRKNSRVFRLIMFFRKLHLFLDCFPAIIFFEHLCRPNGVAARNLDDGFFFILFAHFYFQASGRAVVTGVVPSPTRFLPSIFIAYT